MITEEIETILWWEQFTTSKQSKLDHNFCANLLTSISLCYPQFQFTKNVITTLLDQGKVPIREYDSTIKSTTVRSKPWTLWKSHFRTYCTLRLTGYSTGKNKVTVKPVNLLQWFSLLYYGNQTNKYLVFRCSPLTKIFIFLQCDSIIRLRLFWVWK